MPAFYHLAQLNIARMKAPLDHAAMAGFVAQLAPLNARADASPGFVWRLKTEEGNATELRPWGDPLMLVNLSIWESVDALKAYVYGAGHGSALRDRAQWFEKMDGPDSVLWWIPAGHIPSIEEARARLDHLSAHGDSAVAFSFAKAYSAPADPGEIPPADTDVTGAINCRLEIVVT